MPWQTSFTNKLAQKSTLFGAPARSSGGGLTDAVIQRVVENPEWGRAYLKGRGLDDEDIERILEQENDPGFLAKALGWLDVADAPIRALALNKGRAEMEDRRTDANILETLGRNVGNAALGPLGIFKGTLWDQPEEGWLNPLDEMGNAVRGEQAASFAGLIEDMADEPYLAEWERDIYGNEAFQQVGGIVADIAASPTTYASAGLTSATKSARAAKVAQIAEGGVTASKLADIGITIAGKADDAAGFVARHADEFAEGQRAFGRSGDALDLAKRLDEGVPFLQLPQSARDEIVDAATTWAMKAQEGTSRKVGIPFTRKVIDEAGQETGKLAAGGVYPSFSKVQRDAAGTIFERMGIQPTLKTWGATGPSKQIALGTRAADRGGLKLFGQTVFNTQPLFEEIARRSWTGLNTSKVYSTAKKLVNRYAEIDEYGDRMLSMYMRVRSGDLDAARQVARQLAVKRGEELGEALGVDDAMRLGARIEDVLPREMYSQATKLKNEKDAVISQMDALVKKLGAYDEERVAALRGAAAADAIKANEALEKVADETASAIDQIALTLERLGAQPQTAEALRASAASMRGRQQGLESAVTEVQRAIRQAKSDVDKFASRAADLRERAKMPVFGGADTTTKVTGEAPAVVEPAVVHPQATVEAPPQTLDDFLSTTYTPATLKAEGDEMTERFIEDIRGWLKSHQVQTKYTNNVGMTVDYTDEYQRALGELPGFKTFRNARQGTQKSTYSDFAAELRQMADIYGVKSISETADDHAAIEAFGDLLRGGQETKRLRSIDDVIAEFGEGAVIDDILERARQAQEAGDMATAQAWTDMAEEFNRRLEAATFKEVDPWAVQPEVAAKDVARVEKAGVPPEPRSAGTRPKTRQERLLDVRRTIDDAYARGLVRGRREAARAAVGDAWEAAARSRKAEGREANILEKMASLSDDEARMRQAYKEVSKLETRLRDLKKKAAVQSDRFRRGTAEYERVERTLALIDAKRAEADRLDAEMRAIFEQADYDRMERILIDEDGYTPERAHELRLIAESIRDDFVASQEAKRAVGMGEADLLTGQGSTGYTPSQGVVEQPILEDVRRALDERTGGKLPVFSKEYRARAKVTEDVFGKPYSELEPAGREHGGAAVRRRSIRPQRPQGREYMTKAERVEAGLQTEFDVRHTVPAKLQADADTIAKTRFEDSVLSSSGQVLDTNVEEIAERTGQTVAEVERKVVPDGWVRRKVVRDTGSYDVIIPDVLDKWIKTYEDVFITNESANVFLRGFDRIQNSIKAMLTVWNPAFHARNMPSNYFMAFAQELGDPDSWIEGHRAWAAWAAGKGDTVKVNVGDEVMTATELVESTAGKVGRGVGGSTDIGQVTTRLIERNTPREAWVSEIARTLSPTRVGQAVGDATENAARLSVYLAGRNKGLSHAAAELLPDKVLYNYMPESMTAFEREAVKRLIPFYAWLKQNMPTMIANLAKNPGRLGWYGKMRNASFEATDIDPNLLPDWMRDLAMMPIAAGEGEQNLMFNPSQLPWQDLQRLAGGSKEITSALSPVLRGTFELMANYDFFRERDLETYKYEGERAPGYLQALDSIMAGTGLWESLKEKAHMSYHVDDSTGEQYLVMPGKMRKALREFAPFAENIGKLAGEREALYDTRDKDRYNTIAYLTGVRLTPMDEEYYSEQQIRRMRSRINDELQRLRDEGKL